MKVLMDISNLLHSAFQMNWTKDSDLEELSNLCRHIIIKTIYIKIKDLKVNQSDLIIAVDSKSWRKEFFPYYKYKRKLSRDKSEIDANLMHEFFDSFIEELNTIFPFIVVKVNHCEADDIIATLSKHISKTEDVVIISRDKDFLQLINENIKLFDPFTDTYINKGKIKDHEMLINDAEDAKIYKLLHILIGDTTDGIMNVLSPDHILAFPKQIQNKSGNKTIQERQIPLGWKKIESELFTNEKFDIDKYKEFISNKKNIGVLQEEYNKCKIDEEEYNKQITEYKQIFKNFIRNKKLIDLDEVPENLKEDIIKEYDSKTKNYVKFDFNNVSKYFREHLLDDLNIKLMIGELYIPTIEKMKLF